MAGVGAYQLAFVDPTGTYPTQWASPVTGANVDRVGSNHWAAPRFVWGVSTADGATPYVSVALHTGGSISGTVTDTTGAPRVGACVYVDYASDGAYVGRGAVTDVNGRYTIENLAPTRDAAIAGFPGYKVGFSVDCTPDQAPTNVWNDGASFEAAAPSVRVTAGADTSGVDARF